MYKAKSHLSNFYNCLTPLWFFVATSLLFGLVFIFLIPPFQGGDEPLHFYRAYQISTGNFVVDKNEGNDFGGQLPSSLPETVAITTNHSSLGNLKPNERYQISRTSKVLRIKNNPESIQWVNFTSTAPYSPVAYIPQSAGVLISRVLKQPPIVMMYMGRVFNLFTWVGLIAISIRLAPRKKWAFVFMGLLPVAIFQAATLSADVTTLALFTFSFALILRYASYDKTHRLSNLELATLFVSIALLTLCKQISFVFLPLLLLLPRHLFKSKFKDILVKVSFILGSLLLYFLWSYLIRDLDLKSVFSHHQNPSQQISYMLKSPQSFINILWNTFFFSKGDMTIRGFIGTFGWGDVGLSEWIVTIGYISLFIVIFSNSGRRALAWTNKAQKLTIGFVGGLYAIAVCATLYAYYNPVRANTIDGLQGRYFLPLGMLSVPLFNSGWLKIRASAYRKIAIFTPLFLLMSATVAILYRYYVGNV